MLAKYSAGRTSPMFRCEKQNLQLLAPEFCTAVDYDELIKCRGHVRVD